MHFLSAHFLPELVKSDPLRSGPPPGRARTATVRRRTQTLADGAAATRPSRRALIGLRPDNRLPGGGPERARRAGSYSNVTGQTSQRWEGSSLGKRARRPFFCGIIEDTFPPYVRTNGRGRRFVSTSGRACALCNVAFQRLRYF